MSDMVTQDQTQENLAPKPRGPLHLEPKPRPHTRGEIAFDIATYGGFALIGNEASSLGVMKIAEGPAKPYYDKFANLFTQFKGRKFVPHYIGEGRLPFLLVATIGGMFMVLPIKWMEDHKGKIVRSLDRFLHGKDGEHDTKLTAAHEEMDKAPRQSWNSLWEGRFTTVVSAALLDAAVGWTHAATAAFADKTPFLAGVRDYASFDRASLTIARKIVGHFDPATGEKITQHLAANPSATSRFKLADFEKNGAVSWLSMAGWLLTLSLTLTGLFYVSSKIFAKGRQEKLQSAGSENPIANVATKALLADKADPALQPEQPRAQVSEVRHERALAAAPIAQSI